MMSLTFGLFTQVSNSGPQGPLVQINVLMKLNEYQRSRSLFDLGQRSLRFQNLTLFLSETIESFGTKFIMNAYG